MVQVHSLLANARLPLVAVPVQVVASRPVTVT